MRSIAGEEKTVSGLRFLYTVLFLGNYGWERALQGGFYTHDILYFFYFTFPLVDVDYGTFSFVVCYLFPTSVSSPRRAKPGFNNGSYESFNILPHSKVFVCTQYNYNICALNTLVPIDGQGWVAEA